MTDSKKPIDLRKELYTFDFPDGISEKDGVIHNIHNQVDTAVVRQVF